MKKLLFSPFPIYTHPYSLAQFLPCGAKIENENRIWPFSEYDVTTIQYTIIIDFME